MSVSAGGQSAVMAASTAPRGLTNFIRGAPQSCPVAVLG